MSLWKSLLYIIRWLLFSCYILTFCKAELYAQTVTKVLSLKFSSLPKGFQADTLIVEPIGAERLKWASLQANLFKAGYWAASLDSIINKGDTTIWKIYTGEVYSLSKASVASVNAKKPAVYKNLIEFRSKAFSYLKSLDEMGYPFAALVLDSMRQVGNDYSAFYSVSLGPTFTYDTLQIEGDLLIKKKFLARLLRLEQGKPYKAQQLKEALIHLRTLPYIRLKQEPKIGFSGSRAYPVLFLDKRNANSFDGLIGFLPNQNNNGRLLINGEVNMLLNNLFQTGKMLSLNWKSVRPGNQQLQAAYTHPLLFGTPLEFGGELFLLREDTAIFNNRFKGFLNYVYGSGDRVGVFVQTQNSSLLGTSENAVLIGENFGSTRFTGYGLQVERNRLSDFFFPRTGYRLQVSGLLGNKQIRNKNQTIADTSLAMGNAVAAQNISQFELRLRAENYISIGKRGVFQQKVSGALMQSNSLKTNELYRVGGINSFRGFPENFFFSNAYLFTTLEFRVFTEASTYFLLFAEQGALNSSRLTGEVRREYPTALGAGFSLATKAGQFSLQYALSRFSERGFSIANGNIHLGLVGRF